ncbi:B12-binding domain-containing radical SAM protein [Candidatus Pacearchaeota archaeon]|nr:B12-binding domain-containing radical SAM protein [Candidatus Pacearchaeota archaeon]
MKVLLINPPVPISYYNREFYLPSSLMYIASMLKENKDIVSILDLKTFQRDDDPNWKFFENKVLEKIKEFQPDLIGWGCLFSGNFTDVLKLSEFVKKNFKDIYQVLGGIHSTIYTKEILENCKSIDYIILGEGEKVIVELVNSIKDNKDNKDIEGLAYSEGDEIIINQKQNYIKDINTIPFPAYDLIKIEDYYVDTKDWYNPKKLDFKTSIPIITSRSCPNRCTFCSMWQVMGPMWRGRSAKNVVDEIEYVYKKFNQNHFSFNDDNISLSKSRTIEICKEIINRGLNIQFETPNGLSIRTLDEEVIEWLVKAGLVRVSLAIESGSDYIRNNVMGKHLKKEKIYEVIDIFKKYPQVYLKAFFIIGMPEETNETLNETYEMIKNINVDRIYLHNVVPFPGTKVFEQAKKDNLLIDIDLNDLYKSDALYLTNYDRVFIKPYNLEEEDIKNFRIKCNKLIEEQKTNHKKESKIFLFASATEEKRNKFKKHFNEPYSLGIGYLDSVIRKNNYEILTKDYSSKGEEYLLNDLKEVINEFKPDIIGISVLTITRVSAYKAIKLIKKINPEIKIILGGIHPSLMYEQLLINFPINAICIGDGEDTIIELIKALENNTPLDNIKGIAFKLKNQVIKTDNREINLDLDKIPFPNYNLSSDKKNAHITTSRGCHNNCSYCCGGNKHWRSRSIDNVIEEIEFLFKNYPELETLHLLDENFTLDNKRAIELCKKIIEKKIILNLVCQARIKPVSHDLFYWMEQAGFSEINFGIESGSDKLLKNAHKNITKQDIIDTYNIIKDYKKITPNKFLITGLYGETEGTIDETIEFINKLNKIVKRGLFKANYLATPLMVFPGTEVYEIMKEKNLINDDYWLSDKPCPIFTAEHSVEWINKMSNKILRKTVYSAGKLLFLKKSLNLAIKNPSYVVKVIRKKNVTN